MKLYIDDENAGPTISIWKGGEFVEYGGGFYLKSDDGSLSMLQTWADSNRGEILRKLKRIVTIFNMESE